MLSFLSRLYSGCDFSSCAIISIVGILQQCQRFFALQSLTLVPELGAVGSGGDLNAEEFCVVSCWDAG